MVKRKKLHDLNEYFLQARERDDNGVYFYRINQYNDRIKQFILAYYDAARLSGVVIEGKIQNPDERQLAYYAEIMGQDFELTLPFITSSLKRWLPRLEQSQHSSVAQAIYTSLEELQQTGKNINMLRNAYIKFMCWLYYKFERVVNQLGKDAVPKILYAGTVSAYELKMLSLLSHSGCDIVLLQKEGDEEYRRLDPESALSMEYPVASGTMFPKEFSIQMLQKEKQCMERLPKKRNCTNAWMTGDPWKDILTPPTSRGTDAMLEYNCLIRIRGAEDKVTYLNELFLKYLELKNAGRNVVVVEETIAKPSVEEIAGVKRSVYTDTEKMIYEISSNLSYPKNQELEKRMKYAFTKLLLEEAKQTQMNCNRLMNKAVYLLCWIKRYQADLFLNWKEQQMACFIYFGGCNDENESLFLRYLAKLPVDVLSLVPDLNMTCCLSDVLLFEKTYTESVSCKHFPKEEGGIQMGTAAYHAERELDSLLYQDTGMYRERQYSKATALPLQTMYEEIAILWDQELKYRPNFSVNNDTVHMPVLFAKVSGVKQKDLAKYWSGIKKLMTENTFVVTEQSLLTQQEYSPIKGAATSFYKNGQLQRRAIKQHPHYSYGILREEVQDYMLDKLELMLEQKPIKGMGENGTEYTVIATILQLKQELLRFIQQFDFTKKNPKLVYLNTGEKTISLEDSIVCRYLSLIGFDVVFFVPNGYQTVETHYVGKILEEHQFGEYIYDLRIPDFHRISSKGHSSWYEKIFRRGI